MNPAAKNTFVITRGFEPCIVLYPLDTWEAKEAEIGSLNMYRSEARDLVRIIMMWADEAVLDGQGRVTLPKSHMEITGVTDRAIIVGALDHIEIWNPQTFADYYDKREQDYPALAERVMGSGRG